MLAKYGKKEWITSALICALVSLLLFSLGGLMRIYLLNILSLAAILLWVPLALFFRDPRRKIPQDEYSIVSPADGLVKDIETADCPFSTAKRYKRIGIFLSVLDVHINRMPTDLTVIDTLYKKGSFHDARSELAPSENESNTILCKTELPGHKFPIIIRQISGAIARRIVSEALPGLKFKKGEKFGMIKFGSRTELYLPDDENITVKISVGKKVRAGASILATINKKIQVQ